MLITADVVEEQREKTIKNVAIAAEGAADNRSVKLATSKTTVQITGGYAFVTALSASDVQLYVDVSGLAPGESQLPVQCRIDNAPPFGCALATTSILVTITETN